MIAALSAVPDTPSAVRIGRHQPLADGEDAQCEVLDAAGLGGVPDPCLADGTGEGLPGAEAVRQEDAVPFGEGDGPRIEPGRLAVGGPGAAG
jgi:hypothetical protein